MIRLTRWRIAGGAARVGSGWAQLAIVADILRAWEALARACASPRCRSERAVAAALRRGIVACRTAVILSGRANVAVIADPGEERSGKLHHELLWLDSRSRGIIRSSIALSGSGGCRAGAGRRLAGGSR